MLMQRRLKRITVVFIVALLLAGAGLWRLSGTPEWRFMFSDKKEDRIQIIKEINRKPAWRAKLCAARIIKDEDPDIAHLGLALTAQRGFVDLAPNIGRLFKTTTDPLLKANAVHTLARLGAPITAEIARLALNDDQSSIRSAGALAAGMVHLKELIPLLLELLSKASNDERRAILRSLISLRSTEVLPYLINELNDEDSIDSGEALAGLIAITGTNMGLNQAAWRTLIEKSGAQ